MMILKG